MVNQPWSLLYRRLAPCRCEGHAVHDVLDQRDLVPDEAEHLATSDFPAQELWARAREAAERSDLGELGAISIELGRLRREPAWG